MAQQKIEYQYVDRPEISETYVDTLEKMVFDGQTLRMEFCVNRMNEPKPPNPPTGKKYTACRLVLPPMGLIEMTNKLNGIVAAMEKQGIIKKEVIPVVAPIPGGKPN